ncbi:MAG: ABC transporter permease subunit [Planctomycetaceae bacterium]|nr:ABC transporter permease subunit [Planctomycetaceae bacterium]
MRAFWSLFGLPLLAKELTEQAARRRTYIIRTVYAALLCGFAVLIFWGQVFRSISDPLDMLGQGRGMLQVLVTLQIVGILLFVPALSCGAISAEKESNTFGLLLLTRLGPGTILLEKYLGRVFSMVTFLLLSFPLIGFCYALGGVQQQDIWLSIFMLLTMVFQLSALGIFCSAFFRTTVASFIATYVLGALIFFGPIFIQLVASPSAQADMRKAVRSYVDHSVQGIAQRTTNSIKKLDRWSGAKTPTLAQQPQWEAFDATADDMHVPFFPAPQMMSQMFNNWSPTPTWAIAIRAVPAWMLTGFLLLLARLALVQRAFLQPRNYVMDFFRLIDRMFHAMNTRFTKGVVLVNDTMSLPIDDPVAWREVSKRSLGTFRYLLRIFLAMEIPILTVGLVVLGIGDFSSNLRHPLFLFFSIIAWTLGLLLVVVKSSTIISGERSSETLNVLLSTPLSSREIIWQKLAGVRRLSLVVAIPILTVVGLQMWYAAMHGGYNYSNYGYGGRSHVDAIWLVYGLTQFLCVLVFIPLVSWMSLLIGLLVRTQTRAIFTSLAVLVAWIVVPFVVTMIAMSALGHEYEEMVLPVLLLSPAMLPALMETGELGGFSYEFSHAQVTPYLIILFTLGFYFGLVVVLRTLTLRWAPYLLGRQESGGSMRYKSRQHVLPTLAGRPSKSA